MSKRTGLRLSLNFDADEFVVSSAFPGMLSFPGPTEILNIEGGVKAPLQPWRTFIARPIRITSGYRNPELNRAVGGSPTSHHLTGHAADVVVAGWSSEELLESLWRAIQAGAVDPKVIDQVIGYGYTNHVHIGWHPRRRGEWRWKQTREGKAPIFDPAERWGAL